MAIVKKTTATKPKAAPKTLSAKKKTTSTAKPIMKASVASAMVVKPTVLPAAEPKAPLLNKKALIDSVVLRSGIKKKYAKPVVEAMLEVLGENVALKKDMNLQPFGKILMRKQMDKDSATVSVVKIRQSKRAVQAKITSPISQAAE